MLNSHIPTLFLAIMLVSATLTLAVGLVAGRQGRDGMPLWAAGLASHTLAYGLLSGRGSLPGLLSIVIANGLLSMTFALFGEGLCRFHQRQPNRALLWAPVLVTLIGFGVLVDTVPARLLLGPLVFGVQCLTLLGLLAQGLHVTVGRGQYFIFVGVLSMLFALLWRAAAVLQGDVGLAQFGAPDKVQSLTFMVVLISTLLTTLGYVLMTKERADQRNRQLAMLDDLTGLPNRRFTLQALARQVAAAQRGGQSLTVLMLDIDHFKRVNDQHGHLIGDAMLRHVATILQSRLRGQDLLGRFGGEEFLAILPSTAAEQGGSTLAQALREAVATQAFASATGKHITVTLSVGVGELAPGSTLGAEVVMNAADRALYRAKRGGRNRVELAEPADYLPLAA